MDHVVLSDREVTRFVEPYRLRALIQERGLDRFPVKSRMLVWVHLPDCFVRPSQSHHIAAQVVVHPLQIGDVITLLDPMSRIEGIPSNNVYPEVSTQCRDEYKPKCPEYRISTVVCPHILPLQFSYTLSS